jgi:hypothetical protein
MDRALKITEYYGQEAQLVGTAKHHARLGSGAPLTLWSF